MLVVVKPSGANSVQSHVAWLKRRIIQEKIACEWFYTLGEYQQDVLKLRELAQAHRLLVVIGGDGTINVAVNAIIGLNCQLAILPAGTGNDFARQFNRSLSQWRNAVFGENTIEVDVGCVNGRYFLNVMGLGYNAHVVRGIDSHKQKHRFSYVWAGLKAFFSYRAIRVNSPIFDAEQAVTMLLFANGQYFAAGIQCAPSAKPNNGFLTCIQFSATTRLASLCTMFAMLFAKHEKQANVHTVTIQQFEITTPDLAIEADGEMVGVTPAQVSIHPKAVALRL
ncbi:YegS/Rv2252/BmrU family lipid kinase [Pseudoalteromonas sp. MMG022]|uniref:diacylglycerol/lipid kinase family protein n=1 Tax=Pseudoalteromonas sp. MMG022 TaxID=2909978 RepID=UPI001F02DA3B|nr:YegS/Rv2252/BmrU family lipid kinase [Pseudoalteromonas sp. MMG022]MCF6437333.1 YegS/Rv2252/BmrU family lipid kinase [Pseudoalteromonas sp. MMG022]